MRIKNSKVTPRIVCSIVATMVMASVWGQSTITQPKLVLGVMIEGLSADQLNMLRAHMGDGGFNRLLTQGVTIDNIDYGAPLDPAAASALLYTGATPAVNGVDRATVYDASRQRNTSIYYDPLYRGLFVDQSLSPASLLASTLGDEVRINSDGIGLVYSIALTPEMAMAMAGHAGNSATWINDVTGSWASSTYYKELPTPAQRVNHYSPLSTRLDTMAWEPLLPLNNYSDIPEHRRAYPFRVTFPKKDANRYKAFNTSPLANAEVTSLALEYLRNLHLGEDNDVDMLSLSYSLAPYPYGKDGDTRAMRNDAYVRLDRDLEALFNAIDQGPGLDHTLVFVAGTPARTRTRRDDQRWQIPYGEFSVRRAQTLLNAFLMAKYGNGNWIDAFDNKQIHLNRRLIEQRGIELDEMRGEAADFIAKMSGVTSAASIDRIISGKDNNYDRNNIALQHSADIYYALAPGWEITEADGSSQNLVERLVSTTAPCYILAPGVNPQRISSIVDARAITPTITGQLRIRAPNASATPAIAIE